MRSYEHAAWAALTIVLTVCAPLAAAPQADDLTAAQPAAQGPMIVERVHNPFVAAPDFKLSRIDGSDARLAGGYAGWMLDETLLIGGGGYWLTNNSRAHQLAYGGAIVGWQTRTDRLIGLGLRGLVGGGQATLAAGIGNLALPPGFDDGRRDGRDVPGLVLSRRPAAGDRQIIVDRQFFIAEPQADVFIRIVRGIRLDAGVGYRAIAGAKGVEDRLRGVTGSLGVQVGGSARSRRSP